MRLEPAASSRGPSASTVAILQYGPCWCRGVPGETGSFDFIRQRRVDMDLGPLGSNLVIVSERVLAGSGSVVWAVFDSVPEPTQWGEEAGRPIVPRDAESARNAMENQINKMEELVPQLVEEGLL